MKNIIALVTILVFAMSTSFAQNNNNDPQISINNYKHANKAQKAALKDSHQNLSGQEVSLRSQRTNKLVKRAYVIAPANSSAVTNVQGQKSKANYKNQFN